VGRSTGETIGRIAFRHSDVRFEGMERTSEYPIVSESSTGVFSLRGDSGATVFNVDGEVVGMVLGGVLGRPRILVGHESLGEVYASYVTPITVILTN
jgi:hypothetical protein